MEVGQSAYLGLAREPFGDRLEEELFYPGEQHMRALAFMRDFLWVKENVAVVTAPRGCGKSVLIERFLAELDERVYAAELHSPDLDRRRFLKEMLGQFGLDLDDSDAELRQMLRTFLQHQRSMGRVCLLVLENAQSMPAAVLDELSQLARLEFDRERVLKVLLVGTDALHRVVRSPGMASFVPRQVQTVSLSPFDPGEVGAYIVHRLRAAGAADPGTLLESPTIERIHALSGGVPEAIDDLCRHGFAFAAADGEAVLTLEHLRRAAGELGLPWREDWTSTDPALLHRLTPPTANLANAKFLVTLQGQPEREVPLSLPRMLIGRSQAADLRIHSMYVSRHHALLVRERDHDVLIDLGSTNGVLVNSVRAQYHPLADRDLIQIGPARLVYSCEGATGGSDDEFGSTLQFSRSQSREGGEGSSAAGGDGPEVLGFGRAIRVAPS
jgi:general secretion pathway protein A